MQLQYEHLAYQQTAIDSVMGLFRGELPHHDDDFTLTATNDDRVIANRMLLSWQDIGENMHAIQQNNGLSKSNLVNHHYEFSIEMETGTGKTYVYLKTILSLNKQYGWKKFIIVVPSVAIREGVLQTLRSTKSHFADEFDNVVFNFKEYDSKKSNIIRDFAKNNHIEILVINIQSFEKEQNVVNQEREQGRLIELIQAVSPIVIIDEPQNMETIGRKNAICKLNPLFTLRYSATHKESYHKIYSLNPVQAFEYHLVKQIVVNSVVSQDSNLPFMELKGVINKGGLKAKIMLDSNEKTGLKRKSATLKTGDDLYEKSNRNPNYQGFIVSGVDMESQIVQFTNGKSIIKGVSMDYHKDEIMKQQIHATIKEHIKREKLLNPIGIKVLSLFFIDKVENYRTNVQGETGKFYDWFCELYEQETGQSANGVHDGYFSQDKKGFKDTNGTTNADNDTYELIMKNKERLLSLDEPVRFIFSHSALKEGWDNPNVFQICTLNETTSAIKKRQEIGRGLRLAVNQHGERVKDDDGQINILTVIPNQSYEQFANELQQEYVDDCGVVFTKSPVQDSRNERTVTYRYDAFIDPKFIAIWERIHHKTKYSVDYDSHELIRKASQKIKSMPTIMPPSIEIKKAKLIQSIDNGVETQAIYSQSSYIKNNLPIPDILKMIQDKTGLTRKTIADILKQSRRIDDIKNNPQRFVDVVSEMINNELKILMVDGIRYQRLDDGYEQSLFETYLIYADKYTFEVDKDKINRTIYNGYLDLDSITEKTFATDCQNYDEQIGFYFKLPKKFKIPTPMGNYNPDWAVISNKNGEQVYFIAETKNTGQSAQGGVVVDKLSVDEQLKIACAKALFADCAEIDYKVVEKVDELNK
ncbi:MAG: DEAD/DEAH box helicase family protein [Moraxella sp.]|nr:DEAD/DEAH box helicase family protein [Moraxella sp.]